MQLLVCENQGRISEEYIIQNNAQMGTGKCHIQHLTGYRDTGKNCTVGLLCLNSQHHSRVRLCLASRCRSAAAY